jgi:sigma-E factor negative regulatory protein RseC
MLTETGRVVAIERDSLWVETIRKSTCGTCAARKGCGHGLLNSLGDGSRGYIRVLPGDTGLEGCRIDDEVVISIPEEVILRGSLIAYLLPVACMLAGAIAAVRWLPGSQDVLAALGCLGGLGLGFGLVRWHGHRHRDDLSFQPRLLEVRRGTRATSESAQQP